MRVCHVPAARRAVFDEPNLVACGGLVAVMALAERCGLAELVGAWLTLRARGGGNVGLKVPALVAGMVAGADSIDDMDLLRHGAMRRLFAGVRAPSTLGTFLRCFAFGHVRQLDAVAARLTAIGPLLPGAAALAFVDVDDTVRATYGYAKQGAGYGYTGVKGLNVLLAMVSTPTAAPLIVATRQRRGAANSARGARAAGATGRRADSAFYGYQVVAAARRAGACFSVTARMTPAVIRAIGTIAETGWTAIRYPHAVWDDAERRWISDAEIAEVPFTAFTGRRAGEQVTARLIVRRVRRLNPAAAPQAGGEQGELFTAYRYHACFTDSPMTLVQAEAQHRGHAIVEQVIADLKAGPLAHLPSGAFAANGAWLVCAAMAFNLTRAAGALASPTHAKATTARSARS